MENKTSKTKWKPKLRTLAFFQADLWGELIPGLKSKKFKKLPEVFFGISKKLSKSVGIRLRLKPRESRTTNGRITMERRLLSKFYVGLRKSHFTRIYKKGRRKLGVRAHGDYDAVVNASSDWSFRRLEARVGNLAQRNYTTKSQRSIKQRLHHGFVSLDGAPAVNPGVMAKSGQLVSLYNFNQPDQGISFSTQYRVFLDKCEGWRFKKSVEGTPYVMPVDSFTLPFSSPFGDEDYDEDEDLLDKFMHGDKMFSYFLPFISGRLTGGLVRTYTGQVVFLGGPEVKEEIYYPFPAQLYHFA